MTQRNSTLFTYYDFGNPASELPCEVCFEGEAIAVSFADEGTRVVYRGHTSGAGHWRLECVSGAKGRATLHRFEDEDVLEGWWLENGSEGMWRIRLH